MTSLIGGLGCYAWEMARIHDGLMMLLIVGRNRILSLVVQLLRCYFYTLWCCFCALRCFFQYILLLLWFRCRDVPLSCFMAYCWLCTQVFVARFMWIWYSSMWRKFISYLLPLYIFYLADLYPHAKLYFLAWEWNCSHGVLGFLM